MNRNIYSVGQINRYIKGLFSQDFLLQRISIRGEVSGCKYHTSGHIYFALKDETGVLLAVMFAGSRKNGLNFLMQDGDRVIVTGSIDCYERDGTYQLYAKQIEREGMGGLYQQFLDKKKELEEMGMFSPEYKRPIPNYARRIGVVTSPTGAAIRDIQNIAFRRNPHVQLLLSPALVQGEGAAESIAEGIRRLQQQDVDVIIVGRGGGSFEDLWAFNEEAVAYAIFRCPIPTISAVGHETDTTIADYVADLRAPTPSAAAELAVFDYELTKQTVYDLKMQLQKSLRGRLTQARQKADLWQSRLMRFSPKNRLKSSRQRLSDDEEALVLSMTNRLREARERAERTKILLREEINQKVSDARCRLQLLSGALDGRSPLRQIRQGYAYVAGPDGRALRQVSGLLAGDLLTVHLPDGTAETVVSAVHPEKYPAFDVRPRRDAGRAEEPKTNPSAHKV